MKKILLMIATFSFISLQTACAWFPSVKEPAYTLVKTWGTKGIEQGQFNEPTGIAVFDNQVYVSDSRNARIQVFDLDGNFKHDFGQAGDKNTQLSRPMNINITNNELYVADYFDDRIQIYALDGTFKRSIGKSGKATGEFNAPGGVAVANNGDLYV